MTQIIFARNIIEAVVPKLLSEYTKMPYSCSMEVFMLSRLESQINNANSLSMEHMLWIPMHIL